MELFNVFTVEQARHTLFQYLSPPPRSLKIPLLQSLDCRLAAEIRAVDNVPGFDRSTMDGFAVRATDTFGASEGLPAYLDVGGQVLMGQAPKGEIKVGQGWAIPTGGMLPQGADAVVMVEYTEELDGRTIGVTKPVAPGENVVRQGDDVAAGMVVLKPGHRIRPQDLGLLSAVGITEVAVYPPLKVGILSTGDEIVAPDETPNPGQVRDINSYTLYGLVLENGCIPKLYGIVQDHFEALQEAMYKAMQENDLILVSGGSSVGARDVTARVIDSLGQPGVLFHGIAVKPGKPSIGAVVNGKFIFGLPGHPVSAMVVFELLVQPLLRSGGIAGELERNFSLKARMARNMHSATGREDYIRVQLEERGGELWAEPVLGKSGLIATMVRADGIAKIPSTKEGIEAGEFVEIRIF